MYTEIRDVKILLHKHFYNRDTIQELMNIFQSSFDLFGIEYDDSSKIIQMKIKKTNIKKIPNYSHSSLFYYNIINPIMFGFYSENLESIMRANTDNCNLGYIWMEDKVQMLYNITVIGDNIINIQL